MMIAATTTPATLVAITLQNVPGATCVDAGYRERAPFSGPQAVPARLAPPWPRLALDQYQSGAW